MIQNFKSCKSTSLQFDKTSKELKAREEVKKPALLSKEMSRNLVSEAAQRVAANGTSMTPWGVPLYGRDYSWINSLFIWLNCQQIPFSHRQGLFWSWTLFVFYRVVWVGSISKILFNSCSKDFMLKFQDSNIKSIFLRFVNYRYQIMMYKRGPGGVYL